MCLLKDDPELYVVMGVECKCKDCKALEDVYVPGDPGPG